MAEDALIAPREGLGIAALMARKGVAAATIGAALGLPLADGPTISHGTHRIAIGTGPGSWLVIGEAAGPDFAEDIRAATRGIASVSDQSSGYSVVRIAGAGARRLLQRGLPIDLHPASFGPGSVATGVIAHIGVIVWQVDERPTYDVATFRSFAGAFGHWLATTAAAL